MYYYYPHEVHSVHVTHDKVALDYCCRKGDYTGHRSLREKEAAT
jgi:hypothetical protein